MPGFQTPQNDPPPGVIPLGDVEQTFTSVYGVQLAGKFVACVLFGVVFLQAFIYYKHARNDPFWLKALPAWLVILDFAHEFLYCAGIYNAAITNFGNFSIIFTIGWEIYVSSLFQGLVTSSAHLFFIYRIWRFAKRKWYIPALTIPASALQLALVIAENTIDFMEGPTAGIFKIRWMNYVALAVDLSLDTFFMVVMIGLLKHENNNLFNKTNIMINQLIILTISTGMATTITTMITIILFRAQPTKLNYLFFNSLTSVLYCNSVLTNLNSRDYIRSRGRRDQMPSSLSVPPGSVGGVATSVLDLSPLRFTKFTTSSSSSKKPETPSLSIPSQDAHEDSRSSTTAGGSPYASTSKEQRNVTVATVTIHMDEESLSQSQEV